MDKEKKKKLIIILVVVILLVVVEVGAALLLNSHVEKKQAAAGADTVKVTVSQGDGSIIIGEKLKEAGVISHPAFFRLMAKLKGAEGNWHYGTYELPVKTDYGELFSRMTKPQLPSIRVLLPEGLQAKQMGDRLEAAGVCSCRDFLDACVNGSFDYPFLDSVDQKTRISGLEGYLFPDTYYFEENTPPEEVIRAMLDRFQEKMYTKDYQQQAAAMGFTFDEAVILASMVESEAAEEQDRRIVAGIFQNRLKSPDFPKLQSCVTVEYAMGVKKSIISLKDTKYDSPYNTYLYPGLPYGPICCPGEISLKAVLWPQENDYYYFQSDEQGNLYYAETFAQHANIQTDVQKDWEVKETKIR